MPPARAHIENLQRPSTTRLPRSLRKIERACQIARLLPYARQRCQLKAAGNEFENRRRVVRGVIDVTPFDERRDDQRWHTWTGAPSIARGRRNVVPESAVF